MSIKLLKTFTTKLIPQINAPKLSGQSNDKKGSNLMNKSLPFMKKSNHDFSFKNKSKSS